MFLKVIQVQNLAQDNPELFQICLIRDFEPEPWCLAFADELFSTFAQN